MHTAHERRKSTRVAADLDMRFDSGGKPGLAHISDISSSGVRCTTDRAIPLMTQVGLVIVLPAPVGRREIVCRGAVVRSGPVETRGPAGRSLAFETAIFFTDMRDDDRISVGEFVSSRTRSA